MKKRKSFSLLFLLVVVATESFAYRGGNYAGYDRFESRVKDFLDQQSFRRRHQVDDILPVQALEETPVEQPRTKESVWGRRPHPWESSPRVPYLIHRLMRNRDSFDKRTTQDEPYYPSGSWDNPSVTSSYWDKPDYNDNYYPSFRRSGRFRQPWWGRYSDDASIDYDNPRPRYRMRPNCAEIFLC